MAVEPFADQALCDTTRRRFISERDLGLDDSVQSGVQLFIRQANAGAAVIVPHEVNALLFIQLQPLFRVGRFKGIVTLHRSSPRCEPKQSWEAGRAASTWISQKYRCIGAENLRKMLCCSSFSQVQESPDADRVYAEAV